MLSVTDVLCMSVILVQLVVDAKDEKKGLWRIYGHYDTSWAEKSCILFAQCNPTSDLVVSPHSLQ